MPVGACIRLVTFHRRAAVVPATPHVGARVRWGDQSTSAVCETGKGGCVERALCYWVLCCVLPVRLSGNKDGAEGK